MSSEPRSPAPAYDSDAEKGILDKVAVFPVEKKPLSAPSDEKKDVFPDEKKALAVFSAPRGEEGSVRVDEGIWQEEASIQGHCCQAMVQHISVSHLTF